MIDAIKINEVIKKITLNYNPDSIILFGSYAFGTPNSDSDLDLLIIKQTSLPKHLRASEVRKHLYGMMIPMDLLVYTPSEFETEKSQKYSFLNSIISNCKILYERKD
ncbi:MAG: hypothetical protein COX07_08035 [Bacteroidetes bacterium CG23_combo_of_CG06-09_8_20_14_all_32_9]|nr:MAG: hypothetical protein COX07_08035 [Bacteroidetes bacterium CG23_combo_of_CG06-09_8_20_14_all_32_9]